MWPKIASEASTEITRVGAGVYAPPEHHPDEATGHVGRLTAAADIYSLAKSFYTVICGRAPNEFVRRPITALPFPIKARSCASALLTVLRRATADEVDERYATVIEFWSDLANVATTEETEVEDEAVTRVKPRLQVTPGSLPTSPAQPEFVVTSGSSPVVSAPAQNIIAAPSRPPVDYARPPKIIVDLKPSAPPAVTLPAKKSERAAAKTQDKARSIMPSMVEAFTDQVRRRVFIGLLIVALIGAMLSVYHYALGDKARRVKLKSRRSTSTCALGQIRSRRSSAQWLRRRAIACSTCQTAAGCKSKSASGAMPRRMSAIRIKAGSMAVRIMLV